MAVILAYVLLLRPARLHPFYGKVNEKLENGDKLDKRDIETVASSR
jgi:hypothetical protein